MTLPYIYKIYETGSVFYKNWEGFFPTKMEICRTFAIKVNCQVFRACSGFLGKLPEIMKFYYHLYNLVLKN